MAIYAIGDLHLSLGTDKPMDIFRGWSDYVPRLTENWRRLVAPEDTVVLAGDISWGMSLEQSLADFQYIHQLPGTKIILKGNHDYWWTTKSKMDAFFERNDLTTLKILHNNSYFAEGVHLCGSRGWLFEQGEPQDQKVLAREAGRLLASLQSVGESAGERVAFLHYPPLMGEQMSPEILDVLVQNGVRRCFYGHIHGASCAHAFNGSYRGIDFRLISADFLGFKPIKIEISEDS